MILISVQLHRVVPELRRGDVPRGIDRCRLVVLAAADLEIAAPVGKQDVEEEKYAANPRAADLQAHGGPENHESGLDLNECCLSNLEVTSVQFF